MHLIKHLVGVETEKCYRGDLGVGVDALADRKVVNLRSCEPLHLLMPPSTYLGEGYSSLSNWLNSIASDLA